tara:strand:+ start:549 stop:962 length:414 start_codon:yes stop_codon:yes gene_type:complete
MDSKKKVAVKKPLNTKTKVKPKVKAVLTKKPKVIKLTDNKSDFKLENKAIYFAKLDSCYFCNQMMPEWEKAKQQLSKDISTNSNIKIYEIDGRYLNNYPLLQKRVIAFPTILRYNNGFTPFEQQRSAYNFSNFMKNG